MEAIVHPNVGVWLCPGGVKVSAAYSSTQVSAMMALYDACNVIENIVSWA